MSASPQNQTLSTAAAAAAVEAEAAAAAAALRSDAPARLLLFGLCVTIAAATLVGGVSSLLSLLRGRRKNNPLCLIVASMSVDDLLSVVPLCLFLLLQLEEPEPFAGAAGSVGGSTLCTLSGLLYVFQGLSSNMKACLIAAYTFYVTKRVGTGLGSVARCRVPVLWAVAGVWAVSLCVSALPLCGWGRFSPAPLVGCFPETRGFYVLLIFTVYSLSVCGLMVFFLPLTHQLLCSTSEPNSSSSASSASAMRIYRRCLRQERGGSAPLCHFSRESLDTGLSNNACCDDPGPSWRERGETPAAAGAADPPLDTPVIFAQKRFSMILALLRVSLWMPMMTLVLVRQTLDSHSSSLETLSFFLTLLAPAVTPLFLMSERWIHLPCGCFINCKRDPAQETSVIKRRFDFTLSFQDGCGVYKHSCAPLDKPAYHSLVHRGFSNSGLDAVENIQVSPVVTSSHANLLSDTTDAVAGDAEVPVDSPRLLHERHGEDDFHCLDTLPSLQDELKLGETSSVFEGPERRLSHVECRKIELTDWEWCRSKSERTARQGTISLQAPTGKTLSLSTYEVSSDGLRLSPNNAKKVEVYRSKSVGHEPSAEDAAGSQKRDVNVSNVEMEVEMGTGATIGDTNVKIHLEVLEICDNDEAKDSVSIISNISQSSTHAHRSPSLRYSRRENRFVSCDLAETASYSLLIPSGGHPEIESINISIPDTVEAHRQNSRRRAQDGSGYREEIQMLNEAYRKESAHEDDIS